MNEVQATVVPAVIVLAGGYLFYVALTNKWTIKGALSPFRPFAGKYRKGDPPKGVLKETRVLNGERLGDYGTGTYYSLTEENIVQSKVWENTPPGKETESRHGKNLLKLKRVGGHGKGRW